MTCRICSSNLPLLLLVSCSSFCKSAHISSADSHFFRHSSWLRAKTWNSEDQGHHSNEYTRTNWQYNLRLSTTLIRVGDQVIKATAKLVRCGQLSWSRRQLTAIDTRSYRILYRPPTDQLTCSCAASRAPRLQILAASYSHLWPCKQLEQHISFDNCIIIIYTMNGSIFNTNQVQVSIQSSIKVQ